MTIVAADESQENVHSRSNNFERDIAPMSGAGFSHPEVFQYYYNSPTEDLVYAPT